jgi:phenylalanyl-tRNA synthetase alpha chain
MVDEYIELKNKQINQVKLTEEARSYLELGTPEVQLVKSLEVGVETEKSVIEEKLGKKQAKIAFQKAMQAKWITAAKKTVTRTIEGEPEDETKEILAKMEASGTADEFDSKLLADLKKRKLVQLIPLKYYSVTKGINYHPEKIEMESELTAEMLRDGSWKTRTFKKFNTKALGAVPDGGHLHPLLKVRTLFKEVLIEMGF